MPSERNTLIPVPVTDKNGITSTKWKRPESTAKKTMMPSVQPAPFVSHWDTLRKDYRGVSKLLLNTTAHLVKAKYRREQTISQLTPDTLNVLNKHYGDHPSTVEGFLQDCVREEDLYSMNNLAALIDCGADPAFSSIGVSPAEFFLCIAGLKKYQAGDGYDYSVLSAGEQEIGKALVCAAGNLGKRYVSVDWRGLSSQYVKSENLVALIRKRPEDHRLITSVLLERGLRVDTLEDIDRLEELLAESQLATLRDGAL
jgi:hypothetical protein